MVIQIGWHYNFIGEIDPNNEILMLLTNMSVNFEHDSKIQGYSSL